MTARDDLRFPFALAVAMAKQDVALVDGCLDEYETAHRAELAEEFAAAILAVPAAEWPLTGAFAVVDAAALIRRLADTTTPTKET